MAGWDLLLTDARIATLAPGTPKYGEIGEAGDAALAVSDGCIAWLGPQAELPPHDATTSRSLDGRWLTPALIDCHTHLVFGGDRADEFERRLEGASYEEIARSGGGILSTVRATRDASADELFDSALPRVQALIAEGVATLEIKSGYGLDVENELKMLDVASRLGESTGISVRKTLLAAHTVPPEFSNNADGYIDLICEELLPAAVERGLADAVDAYCESIAFSAPQIARLFRKARELRLPLKLHADQLSDGGGAELAAYFGALSADHLEYTSVVRRQGDGRSRCRRGAAAGRLPHARRIAATTRRGAAGTRRANCHCE